MLKIVVGPTTVGKGAIQAIVKSQFEQTIWKEIVPSEQFRVFDYDITTNNF